MQVRGASRRGDQLAVKMNLNTGAEIALDDPLCGLVVRLQAGDKAALEEIIRQTQKLGYRLAFSLLQDRQLAEDALQEVYLKVYQNLNQLREPKAFKGWFCRILSNHCGKMRRKQSPDFLEDLTPSQQPQQSCQGSEVDTRLEVRQAFAQLSVADREVLALREVLDLSYEEMSTTLKVPATAIKTRLFKARQRLLKFLGGRS
jgi:RNA polymerase sigma-70 factor (ECF subfamily)